MAAYFHKITVLILMVMLALSGVATGYDGCSAGCEHHHNLKVKSACCEAMATTAERGAHNHKPEPSPCSDGAFCAQSETNNDLLTPASSVTDLLPVVPAETLHLVHEQSSQWPVNSDFPAPEISPPIYKLYCSYLH